MATLGNTLQENTSTSHSWNFNFLQYLTTSEPAAAVFFLPTVIANSGLSTASLESTTAENASGSHSQGTISELLAKRTENVTTIGATTTSFIGQTDIGGLVQNMTSLGGSFVNTASNTTAAVNLNESTGEGNSSVGILVSFPSYRLYGLCSASFGISLIGLSLFLLTGTVGNTLSCIVMLRKRMRRISICNYLAALAFTEFIMLTVNNTYALMAITEYQTATLAEYCAPLRVVLNSTAYISSQLLCAVSIERFIAVSYPMKSKEWLTVKKSRIVIFCIIVFNGLFNIPILWVYGPVDLKFKGEPFIKCVSSKSKLYTTVGGLFYSYMPLTIIVSMNLLILLKIYQQSKKMRNMHAYQSESAIQWRLVLKTLPVLASLSIMFFLTTVPAAVTVLLARSKNSWATIDPESSNLCSRLTLWSILDLVRVGNYSMNFFIYCLTSENVRQELATMFGRKTHQRKLTGTRSTISLRTISKRESTDQKSMDDTIDFLHS